MTITAMKDITQAMLDWLKENYGADTTLAVIVLIVVLVSVILAGGYILLRLWRKSQSSKSNSGNNAHTTGHHSPVVKLGDNARVRDLHIGDENNITIMANPAPSPSAVILGEYEAKQRALLEKGGLPILDLTWHVVRRGQTALVELLNALAPNRVMHAYMSEERAFQYGGPVYRHYIVETAHSGYVKQECAGRQMGRAFADNVWPFYFITYNESAETVEEMSPHRAVCHYREIDDNMRKAEELYNSVKAKVGSPFDLL